MKSRTHTLLVRVTFDKACSRQVAQREARDLIHGTEYCTQHEDHEPGEFRVRPVKLAAATKRAAR